MENKVLVCFYKNNVEPYMERLQKFEEQGFIVHVFDNIDNETLEEFNLKNILDNTLGENYKEDTINIMSNIETLTLNLFKKHSFEYNSFIYDNSTLYENEVLGKDRLINDEENICEYNYNLYSVKKWGNNINYIILNNTNMYDISIEKVKNYIACAKIICQDEQCFLKCYLNVNSKAKKLKNYINKLNDYEKEKVEQLFIKELENENDIYVIYISSFLLYTFKKKIYGDEILNATLNSDTLDKNNRFFIMYQLISAGFTDENVSKCVESTRLNRIYDKVFYEFEQAVGECRFISKKNRNKDLIFIFISQFLTLTHGPTKTVLDRCYSLSKYMDKIVILINTKELITNKGMIPMDDIGSGSVIEEYKNKENIEFKDIEVPYYQPACKMPDVNECINIVNLVKKHKPYLIFNIGGYSITADLCSKIVPMATISTSGNYSISKTKGQFFIMGRKPMESDYEYISKLGYEREAIIESPFTFDLKPQTHNYFRKDFGLPEDKFIVTFVGGRLSKEVDEDFIKMLDEIACKGCFVVSIGGFEIPNELASKYPSLNNNFKDLGFQEDILACVDLVDLYLNPKRQGGGTSAVECMYKGKPALSLKCGDVSMLVDENFLVEDYAQMIKLIEKCKDNKDVYREMSEKGKVKAADLMNTKKYFKEMYDDIVHSKLFK